LVASCGVPYGSSEATNQLAVNTDVPVSTKSRQSQSWVFPYFADGIPRFACLAQWLS